VQRLDLSWVIETFRSIDAATEFQEGMEGLDAWLALQAAKGNLDMIYQSSVYSKFLKVSIRRADQFASAIGPIVDKLGQDFDYKITRLEAHQIREAAKEFKLVFLSEFAHVPAYLVTKKDNYDLDSLIENGTSLFGSNLILKAPEAEDDALEAGRCIAFERNTACGFHTFRVVEAVLRRYWDVVTSGKPRPKIESLGKMANELKDGGHGDSKVSESLVQLARLHRNPLAHPDVILTADEAIAALGMARSVITHMLAVLPDVPPTTGAAL
jgi:hypothetical protein